MGACLQEKGKLVMGLHQMPLPDIVVQPAATDSNILLSAGAPTAPNMVTTGDGFRDADSITIFAPDTLPETATVHVDSAESAVNFDPLQRAGVDVAIGAGKAVTIELISFKALKIVLSVGAAATRTFKVVKGVWI